MDSISAMHFHHSICDFPLELFYWVQEYVDINNILLTSSRLHGHRRQLYRWHLSVASSNLFLDNPHLAMYIHFAYRIVQVWWMCQHWGVCIRCTCPIVQMWVDVSALGHVHILHLFRCPGVTDVSALGNVHTLCLANCSGVTDVSALGNVHTLHMSSSLVRYREES